MITSMGIMLLKFKQATDYHTDLVSGRKIHWKLYNIIINFIKFLMVILLSNHWDKTQFTWIWHQIKWVALHLVMM